MTGYTFSTLLNEDDKQRINDIYSFWFGTTDEDLLRVANYNLNFKLWFVTSEAGDLDIKNRFQATLEEAGQPDSPLLARWRSDHRGKMALILLCDQFSRNMFRGTGQMFQYDPISCGIVLDMLSENSDKSYSFPERMFFYVVLEHSEQLDIVERSVEKTKELAEDAKEVSPIYGGVVKYAQDHYAIVKQFNRYPHRNALLGRESTAEETEYLSNSTNEFEKSVQKKVTTTTTITTSSTTTTTEPSS
ncbi:hypothetical protein PPL_11023 [Heterostelium album PN500]|uniref:DUF924 domain-containing protein n=1 Tax=Heterostelium pallidum (strain ATCC 26659 / Pp 5 / PN500) TaxID=670386 RepID=D3BSQ4_HETP5|nr:hypothetical protein PPL_11023 [Heterostelium album PN500]EFA75519.1 hypothetical protein PPL_11023 [Heterostelium album PN500]|eukprot:XP_020427653.1 hypothetical protein PPL_11023 [Heterostelium album PN500]